MNDDDDEETASPPPSPPDSKFKAPETVDNLSNSSDGSYVWAEWEIIIVVFCLLVIVVILAILCFGGTKQRAKSIAAKKASLTLSTQASMATQESNAVDAKDVAVAVEK